MTETLCLLPETPDLLDALIEALKSLTVPPAAAPGLTKGAEVDVLSDVLRVVRLSGAVFFTADFSSPWAIESPIPALLASAVMPEAECVVLFHILVEGECEVVCQGHPVTTMEGGDVIVFPRGDQHTMRSHGAVTTTPLTSSLFAGQVRRAPAAVVRRGWKNVALRLWLSELRPAVQSAGRGAADDAARAKPR